MNLFARLLFLLGLSVGAYSFAAGPPPAKVVVTSIAEITDSETQRLLGVIDFERVSAVSGEVSGLITAQFMSEGKLVKAGDPLVELNTDFMLKDIAIKTKQRAQVSADLQKLANTLKRLKRLLQNNSASRQAYDDALYDHRSFLKKRESLDLEIERLQLSLKKSKVRAPFDGVILEKLKEQGEWMPLGSAVCKLASTNDLIVKIALSEKFLRFQKNGESVDIEIEALGLKTQGRILGFIPTANIRSKSVVLKLSLPYQPGMFRNMSVAADIVIGKKRQLLVLPRDAVVSAKGKDIVYVVNDNKATVVPVNIIMRKGERVGVEPSSLKIDSVVIVDGNERLRPGQSIEIISR